MKTNHTPGPWEQIYAQVRKEDMQSPAFTILRGTTPIADIPPSKHAEQDARLIASAPDLLAALELALKCADDHGADHFGYGEYADTVRAAITQAKGEAQ